MLRRRALQVLLGTAIIGLSTTGLTAPAQAADFSVSLQGNWTWDGSKWTTNDGSVNTSAGTTGATMEFKAFGAFNEGGLKDVEVRSTALSLNGTSCAASGSCYLAYNDIATFDIAPGANNTPVVIYAKNPVAAGSAQVEAQGGGSLDFTVTNPAAPPTPAITGVSPSTGPEAGGTSVTISGTDLDNASSVTFGGNAASSFTVDDSTQITATTPAGTAGAVDVAVTTPGGDDTSVGAFTYIAPTDTTFWVRGTFDSDTRVSSDGAFGPSSLQGSTVTLVTNITWDDTDLTLVVKNDFLSDDSGTCSSGCVLQSQGSKTFDVDSGAVNSTVAVQVDDSGTLRNMRVNASDVFFQLTYIAPAPDPTPTPTPATPPSAPESGDVEPGSGAVTVSWEPPATQGSFPVTNYQVQSTPGSAGCLVAATQRQCTVSGLTNGRSYSFQVRALNGGGWGPWADAGSATPVAPAEATILISGTRGDVRGKPGIIVTGTTTGLTEGSTLHPWIRLDGQRSSRMGEALITLDASGEFTWQRRVNRNIDVQIRSADGSVRSEELRIAVR